MNTTSKLFNPLPHLLLELAFPDEVGERLRVAGDRGNGPLQLLRPLPLVGREALDLLPQQHELVVRLVDHPVVSFLHVAEDLLACLLIFSKLLLLQST